MFAVVSARAEKAIHPDYQPVVPGLDYAHVQMQNWDKDEPWSIHIARLDRKVKSLHVASMLSQNEIFGIAPISAQAKTVPKTTGTPLVAINDDFCIVKKEAYQGVPRGVQIMEGQLVSPPLDYSFWVEADGKMSFADVKPNFSVTLPDGKTHPLGFNHECKPKKIVLFTSILGPSTRATNHLEIILENAAHGKISWNAGKNYALRIKSINPSGNSPLTESTAVLTFGTEISDLATNLHTGDEIKLVLASDPDLSKAVTAIGCIFPLIRDGKIVPEFDGSKYLLQKHPRTAIGFNARYFFMVVVDGRQKGLSMGMYPKELAEFMAAIGCTEAMNMDGGGSSTFWLTGKTRNSPSDKHERYLSNGLTIVRNSGQ